MKCMHCLIDYHPNPLEIGIGDDADGTWALQVTGCPACNRFNIFMTCNQVVHITGIRAKGPKTADYAVRPNGATRLIPTEVPPAYANDYREAAAVLPYSAQASAALSRRCLQNLIHGHFGIKKHDLYQEISEVIATANLPSAVTASIDAVRVIGNFAAHPLKCTATGSVIPVDPEEAEWTLDVLDSLFDFCFVQPAILQAKKVALNAKLTAAGKPVIP